MIFTVSTVPSARHHATGCAPPQRAVAHAAEREPPDVRRRIEVGHERLERMVGVVGRRGDVLDEQLEQRLQPAGARCAGQLQVGVGGVERRATGARVGVHDRELDLVLVGVEVEEQLFDLVHDLGDPCVAAVDLVDHER